MKRTILLFMFFFLSAEMYSANIPDTIVSAKLDSADYYSRQKARAEILKINEETNTIRKNNSPGFLKSITDNSGAITALLGLLGVLYTFWKFREEQHTQRIAESTQHQKDLDLKTKEKDIRIEENFNSTIGNLGSENQSLKASAIISLIIYCKIEYKVFHEQILLICFANLKLNLDESINKLFVTSFEKALRAYLQENSLAKLNIKLTHLTLDSIDLSGLNLEGVDLAFSSLKFANLYNTNLRRMKGLRTNFFGADLSGANLQEGKLQKANFEKSKMKETNLISADLKHSNLKNCKLHKARMQAAHLQMAVLTGTEFDKADISDAYFWDLPSDIKNKTGKANRLKNTHFL